ncbi:MAG: NAD-dependent epimerase/dehydratase family protein [Planctomycetota bacterium]
MKALVTGANGFLGFRIVEMLLERGYEVTGMTRRAHEFLDRMDVRSVIGDIRSYENVLDACRDQDVVFHTAAIAGIWGPWKLFHSTNTVGTKHVVEACRECKVPKLVFTSSPSVTFDGQHQVNTDETAPYPKKWLCHYPHSKALAEKYVLEADDHRELMTCALRPHLIWGPGDNHLVPRLIERARSKKLRRVGDGTNQVDTIYIDNAAEAHLMAAEAMQEGSPVCGQAYFISQDDPVNLWGWINEVLELAGLPRVKQKISLYWASKIGHGLEMYHEAFNLQSEPRMTRFLAAQLAKSHYFDISRAKRDFGYFPRVSNDEGMKRLAASMSKQS